MKLSRIPPLERHATHETQVRAGSGPHSGQLWCVKCRKHIQWITQTQYQLLLNTKI